MHSQILHGMLDPGGAGTLSMLRIRAATSEITALALACGFLGFWLLIWLFALRPTYSRVYWDDLGISPEGDKPPASAMAAVDAVGVPAAPPPVEECTTRPSLEGEGQGGGGPPPRICSGPL